ncbi:MAG TPA: hypothetical protein VF266_27780 [Thermoanaerobaculia bacterium]
MQLTRFLTLLLITAALAVPALADCPRVATDGQSIWLEEGANQRVVTTDPLGVELPSWFGSRIAYSRVRVDDAGIPVTEVVVIRENGDLVRVLAVPEDAPVTGAIQLGWRDSKRVFLEGHVNPSVTLYLEWDADSGELTHERAGLHFALSPNGRSLAQWRHVPLGAPEEVSSAALEVDGEVVHPAADDTRYHSFLSVPVWARNSHRIAVIDSVDGAAALIVVSLDGKNVKTARVPLTLTAGDPKVSWSGDHVIVRTEGEALRIHPQTGSIEAALPGEGDADGCSQ